MKLKQTFRQNPPYGELEEFEQEDENLSFEEQTSRELHRIINESYQALENLGLRKKVYFCDYILENDCHWTRVQTPALNYIHASNEFEALEKFLGQLEIEEGVVVSKISVRDPHIKWKTDIYGNSVQIVDSETRNQDWKDHYEGKRFGLIAYVDGKFFVDGQEVERENPIYNVFDRIIYLEEGHIKRALEKASERIKLELRKLGEE